MEGLSAQKNVHSCTFFCAYENLGMRIREQGSGVGGQESGVRGRTMDEGGWHINK